LLFGIVVFFVSATVGIVLTRPAPPPDRVFVIPNPNDAPPNGGPYFLIPDAGSGTPPGFSVPVFGPTPAP
jgi:hypothetical protein